MPTDTTVNNLVINKLTKAQYDSIVNPSSTELYLVPDEIDTTPTSGSTNPVTSNGIYNAISGLAQDSAVVHKTGNLSESINGEKIFTSGVVIDGTSNLEIEQQSNITFNTDDSTLIHQITLANAALYSSGTDAAGVLRFTDTETSKGEVILRNVHDPIDGSDVANKHYVDASIPSDANFVHKTGTETISGLKTFNDDMAVKGAMLLGQTSSNTIPLWMCSDPYVTVGGVNYAVLQFGDSDNDNPILLRGVHSPIVASDAVNKSYLDNIVGDIETLLAAI